eukprot:GHVU01054602.1.p1 GENE.GHVU01054602.1~~GHVU01054602.1.p1  ORF type:complete len:174 (-),score=3.39 GHVU01054602.1:532-1053(-)
MCWDLLLHAHTYTHTHAHIHTHIHIHTYTHMHTHIHIHTHSVGRQYPRKWNLSSTTLLRQRGSTHMLLPGSSSLRTSISAYLCIPSSCNSYCLPPLFRRLVAQQGCPVGGAAASWFYVGYQAVERVGSERLKVTPNISAIVPRQISGGCQLDTHDRCLFFAVSSSGFYHIGQR